MLTIKVEENAKPILDEMGIEAKKGAVVMAVRDSETLLGVGVMRLHDDFVIIDDICMKEADFSLEYGLGKALLNTADLRGSRHAVTDRKDLARLLTALKFRTVDEAGDEVLEYIADFEYYLNLDGYFVANC